ncbi:hypothetical protein SS50377_25912 [Spironucleus salmonicida]|uniref:Uncharacterized protein n=1 Tax=Spironucleus salmonicida TaxID=348837 RepID=V6LTC9_9EUKA|nr:hypothetical protein SS50377_25907 [Spironucleus salmonicida]KAH0571721.1 hypothetical protein SS50377_25912 [Spironucleus salmonicida]|eukprot:EST47835.1 Hypothetical protein SS50377_12074 [Spironucleus salmonicida]
MAKQASSYYIKLPYWSYNNYRAILHLPAHGAQNDSYQQLLPIVAGRWQFIYTGLKYQQLNNFVKDNANSVDINKASQVYCASQTSLIQGD